MDFHSGSVIHSSDFLFGFHCGGVVLIIMAGQSIIMSMGAVLGFLIVGICVGYLIRHRERLVRLTDRLMMWTIYLFLFILGLSVGVNEEIVRNIGTLGVKAGILTAGGLTGSIVAAYLLHCVWFKEKQHEE